MYIFQPEEIYRIGHLTTKASNDPANPYPIFLQKPNPISISGSNLISQGIKDFTSYLKKNPHNFKSDKTIYLYRIKTDTGNYERIDEGNLINRVDNQRRGQYGQQLSDKSKPMELNSSLYPNYGGQQLNDMFENRLRDLQDELRMKNARIEELTQKLIDKDDSLATLKAEKRVMEIDNEKLEGALEGYVKQHGSMNGLSDGSAAGLMDKFAGTLGKIAEHPAGQEALANIIGWVSNKLQGGKSGEPIVQQQQLTPDQIQQQQFNQAAKSSFMQPLQQPVNGQGGSIANI